ncbi:unnamed protein product [Allacma fusca]|uniref:Chlorophyllase n=1 Tax=Allacma fusca TaxID=39272 RepID=A0A8J2LGU8_9HEXA|nr:unnamed protein product [Allacma fusca]
MIDKRQQELTKAELFNPYEEGPYEVLFKHYDWHDTGLEKNLDVFAPNGSGPFPLIFYSNSLASNLDPATSVVTVLNHIASWGFVILAPWKLNWNIGENYKVDYVLHTLSYAQRGVEEDLRKQGAPDDFSIDFSNSIIMGHSAGNHQNVNFLKLSCANFSAQILLSPVDGADPFGLIPEYCITPGEKLNYVMPTLTIQAGLDPKKGSILYPACAPADLSNMRYYNAMAGDRWFVNASAYGHTDFFEPGFTGIIDFFNVCATDSHTNKTVYMDFTAGSAVAFAKAMTDPVNHCDMLAYVEDPELMTVETNIESDVVGGSRSRCNPGCTWNPPATTTTQKYL